MTSDLDLLEKFVRENSQDAFGEIVQRHLNLVYSAALPQVRSRQLAEEIAQSVFADLAQNAGKIGSAGVSPANLLTPWLYTVTRRTAIDVIRRESRRQLREQIAVEMNTMNATESSAGASPAWSEIEKFLDDAMESLDETDRSAVLLRYFENKSLREVGEALGASEDAAQKRISRAVDRLRESFSKRKVTVGASGLAVLISANAVQSAPIGLAATISTAAVLAGTTVSATTVVTATKTIAMTALQKTLITATVAVLTGAGIYEARQATNARLGAQTLQQQQAQLIEQIRQLQKERDDATNQLGALFAENEQLNRNKDEMLKLRGEVGSLRQQLDRTKAEALQAAPQIKFDLPYSRRDEWSEKGTAKPLDTLFTMLWAIKQKDENRLNQIVLRTNPSYTLDQLTLPKTSWDTASAIQIVSWGWAYPIVDGRPQDVATIEAVLEEKHTDTTSGQTITDQTVERWSLIKTNNQWLLTGLR
jgi:RNA polymerase sigma factor (sigma-70 family)